MPYAPSVNDMSGEILARYELAGAQATSQAIMQAGNSILLGGVKANEKIEQNKQEGAMLDGKASAYQEIGMMDAATLDKFQTGNLNTKRAVISGIDTKFFHQMQQQQAGNEAAKVGIAQGHLGVAQKKVAQDQAVIDQNAGWTEDNPMLIKTADGAVGTVLRMGPNQRQFIPGRAPETQPNPVGQPHVKDGMYWDAAAKAWKPKPAENWMNGLMGGAMPGAAPAPAQAAAPAPAAAAGPRVGPRVGQRARQNGKNYVFTAQGWVEE